MPTVSGTEAFWASVPILTILILMLVVGWSAARAGMIGFAVALVLAWKIFGYGAAGELNVTTATAGAMAEAVFTAATILWIVFTALCVHHLEVQTGAIEVLRASLGQLSSDPRISTILIGWFFALFLEGAAGFGAPVALAAPLLVTAGLRPVQAVAIALIGHSVGVSFGAVGTPILPQITATGLSGSDLARATGLYHSLLGWLMLTVIVAMAVRAFRDAGNTTRAIAGWTVLAAALFLVPYFVISRWVGPELPTLGSALVGGIVFVVVLRLARRQAVSASGARHARQGHSLLRAGSPYLILVTFILLTRLVPPVRQLLTGFNWEWSFADRFQGNVQPLFHPGTMLLLGCLLGAYIQRATWRQFKAALAAAAKQLGPVAVALVAMLGLSRVMVHAGMINSLAVAAADILGGSWPLFAPFVGVLGTFVTGSATTSNILFTDFQQATAQHLALPVIGLAGAQGFGAAVGNIVCPHNIIAGAATVWISGQEGQVLKRTLWVCVTYAMLGGIVAFVIVGR